MPCCIPVPIITLSTMGGAAFLDDLYETRKLAPTPPVLSDSSIT
jgi:hypothetical protein